VATLKLSLTVPVTVRGDAFAALLNAATAEAVTEQMATGAIPDAVRKVLSTTVLREYRKLVLGAMGDLLAPALLSGSKVKPVQLTLEDRAQWLRTLQQLDTAKGAERKTAERKLRLLQRKLAQRLERRGERPLSTGLYRKRIDEVIQLMTAPQNVEVWLDAQRRVRYGIGRLALLKKVLVPSFAVHDENRKSTSKKAPGTYKNAVMWRQIEYGTGQFYKGPGKQRGKYWYFGPLGLKGAKGVRAFPALEAMMKSIRPELRTSVQSVIRGGTRG
jgi:hypothetical protein